MGFKLVKADLLCVNLDCLSESCDTPRNHDFVANFSAQNQYPPVFFGFASMGVTTTNPTRSIVALKVCLQRTRFLLFY